ncbi:MAG: hypothetical protein HFF06_07045 [Oscillospiraceae bacterium]|nr:hypothetical protein [Oscillospiraceae bacterium]
MPKDRKHLSIRLDGELHDKFQYVAKYDGRSMSKQILYLVTSCVREFEKEHGPITEQDIKNARS